MALLSYSRDDPSQREVYLFGADEPSATMIDVVVMKYGHCWFLASALLKMAHA